MCVRACVRACVCACVCVCVWFLFYTQDSIVQLLHMLHSLLPDNHCMYVLAYPSWATPTEAALLSTLYDVGGIIGVYMCSWY